MSVKKEILEFLKDKPPTYAGIIEDHIRSLYGPKGSTANRRMQELCKEGKLLKVTGELGKKYQLACPLPPVLKSTPANPAASLFSDWRGRRPSTAYKF